MSHLKQHPHLTDTAENERMVAHTRPKDWAQEPADHYDLIAIGGGTGGLASSGGAALLGARAALVERDLMGGDCLVSGCVPSKALIHAARLAHDARVAEQFGIKAEVSVDFTQVMRGVRERRANVAPHDSAEAFRQRGVDVLFGEARFLDPRTLDIGGKRVTFRRAVIATGSRPVMPPVPGLAEARPLTNETLFELSTLPARLLVLGGGPIGCEMAQAFSRLGAKVTQIQKGERLLNNDIPEAGELLAQTFRAEGIDLRLGIALQQVDPLENGSGIAHLSDGSTVPFDRILVAAGRTPVLDALDLDAAGVAYDQRGITVNPHLRTTNRRIYAVGDCVSDLKFTHAAYAQAEYAVFNALYGTRFDFAKRPFPWCTYTDPEVAHVSYPLCDDTASTEVIQLPMQDNDRALSEGETAGFIRIAHRKGKIISATVVGRNAGDWLPEITATMVMGKGLDALARVIHTYSTRGELLRHAADTFMFTKVTPTVRKMTTWWQKLMP